MADKYSNYAELVAAEEEDIDFEVVVVKREPPRVAVIAPHAGRIEPKTGPIAREIAGAEFSLYCFRGMKTAGNKDLHITSHHFDEPRCLELIKVHKWVVTIHGCQKKVSMFSLVDWTRHSLLILRPASCKLEYESKR